MASTSLHIPTELLEQLDRLAAERGLSRNRLVLMACRQIIQSALGEWPEGFFTNDHLSDAEVRELRDSEDAFRQAIWANRRSHREPPF